jgi:hypothetical protein
MTAMPALPPPERFAAKVGYEPTLLDTASSLKIRFVEVRRATEQVKSVIETVANRRLR